MRKRSGAIHADSSDEYIDKALSKKLENQENHDQNNTGSTLTHQLENKDTRENLKQREDKRSFLDNFDFKGDEANSTDDDYMDENLNSPSVVSDLGSNSALDIVKPVPILKTQKAIKCMVIGASNVGKHKLLESSFVQTNPESPKDHNGCLDLVIKRRETATQCIKYQFWVRKLLDTRYDTLVKVYYKSVSVFVFVYDITDRESFEKISEEIENVKEEASENFVGLLIANKVDIQSERQVEYDEGFELKKKFNLSYFVETSHLIELNTPQIIRKIDELSKVASE